MATIHDTTMAPTKLELLEAWLPRQPWYRGSTPDLDRTGGFRLDDPAGEVGIEVLLVRDRDGTTYAVPLTYRGAPLPGVGAGLVGTSQHGVLGTRWIYDAEHDPVAVAQFEALARGEVVAQHRSRSDTPDPSVTVEWTGRPEGPVTVGVLRVVDGGGADGEDGEDGTDGTDGTVVGHVVAPLDGADGPRRPVAVLRRR